MKKQLFLLPLLILNSAVINGTEKKEEKKIEEQKVNKKVKEDLYNCYIYAESEETRQIIKKSLATISGISQIHDCTLSNPHNDKKTYQVTCFDINFSQAVDIRLNLKDLIQDSKNLSNFWFKFRLAKNVRLDSWQLFNCKISNLNNANAQIIIKALEAFNDIQFSETEAEVFVGHISDEQTYEIDGILQELKKSKENFTYNLSFYRALDVLQYLNHHL